jgi:protein-S-isoprenylcysteine O-methyltransferase Ste14
MQPMTASISDAERSNAARLGQILFRNRGWLPVPLLVVPLLARGEQSLRSWGLGVVLIVLGELIRVAGVAAAGTVTRRRTRNVQRLVTYGAFAWCRNPLYVGNFFVWIGFTIASGVAWFVPIAIVLFALEYTLIVRYEEGVLESIFGRAYLEYKARTPRWFGRPPASSTRGPHEWNAAIWSERSTFMQYVAIALAFWIKATYIAR